MYLLFDKDSVVKHSYTPAADVTHTEFIASANSQLPPVGSSTTLPYNLNIHNFKTNHTLDF